MTTYSTSIQYCRKSRTSLPRRAVTCSEAASCKPNEGTRLAAATLDFPLYTFLPRRHRPRRNFLTADKTSDLCHASNACASATAAFLARRDLRLCRRLAAARRVPFTVAVINLEPESQTNRHAGGCESKVIPTTSGTSMSPLLQNPDMVRTANIDTKRSKAPLNRKTSNINRPRMHQWTRPKARCFAGMPTRGRCFTGLPRLRCVLLFWRLTASCSNSVVSRCVAASQLLRSPA